MYNTGFNNDRNQRGRNRGRHSSIQRGGGSGKNYNWNYNNSNNFQDDSLEPTSIINPWHALENELGLEHLHEDLDQERDLSESDGDSDLEVQEVENKR